MKPTVGYAVLFMALCAAPSVSLGQGVGGNSPTWTSHTLDRVEISTPEDPISWSAAVGSVQAAIQVALDPSGLLWTKEFQTSDGSAIAWHDVVQIEEHLVVAGNRAWTGWDTQIMTNGITWNRLGTYVNPVVILANGSRPSGLYVTFEGASAHASFDPLPAGTQVTVLIKVMYNDPGPFAAPFEISQFPTPEPTTFLFLILVAPLIRRQ